MMLNHISLFFMSWMHLTYKPHKYQAHCQLCIFMIKNCTKNIKIGEKLSNSLVPKSYSNPDMWRDFFPCTQWISIFELPRHWILWSFPNFLLEELSYFKNGNGILQVCKIWYELALLTYNLLLPNMQYLHPLCNRLHVQLEWPVDLTLIP